MTTRTTTKTAPAKGLRESRKEQAAARKPAAAAKATAKPAAKTAPAKPTPAKKAAAPKSDTTEKRAYSATARCGKVNIRQSATPLIAALDCKIAGRKNPQFAAGVVVNFYATVDAAQKAADEINGGKFDGWSDAIVVDATLVKS